MSFNLTKKLVAVTIALMFVCSVWGEDKKENNPPELETYKMGIKLCRGITNMATGIGEFPRQIYLCTKKDGALGVPYGLGSGLAMTIVRTLYGVAETAFFYVPFDGGYDSALNPAFVWQEATVPEPKVEVEEE
jgi:putative exosortase-associated protein (TIGR04073 family)